MVYSQECLIGSARIFVKHTKTIELGTRAMKSSTLGFRCVKVVAISVRDFDRASKFYGETLGLPPAYEQSQQVGYLVDRTILMLKPNWDVPPTTTPNPRVTLETEDARQTEKDLRRRGVEIADPVDLYDGCHLVGSFLDSEGNKLWFCSYAGTSGEAR
jgi:catechol 2,3-dioxygenase-like lactoylglutathione lyase family enzyme